MPSWKEDFRDFSRAGVEEVPAHLNAQVIGAVKADLCPSQPLVFLKLMLVHLLSGGLTLTVCPQFGIGPLGGGAGLMGIFMQWGHGFCAIACGTFFFGTTALVSQLVLRRPELTVVYQHRLSQFSLLGAFSVALLMLSSRLAYGEWMMESFQYTALWLSGGVLSASLLFLFQKRAHWQTTV